MWPLLVIGVIGIIGWRGVQMSGVAESGARGIRNKNPGNIRISATKWQGKLPERSNTDGEFEQFETEFWGIRALARNLYTYYHSHGARTPRDIISRWAPALGNRPDGSTYTQNTGGYVAAVSSALGIGPDEIVPVPKIPALVEAIIRHENGAQPYASYTVRDAVQAAGWGVNA